MSWQRDLLRSWEGAEIGLPSMYHDLALEGGSAIYKGATEDLTPLYPIIHLLSSLVALE